MGGGRGGTTRTAGTEGGSPEGTIKHGARGRGTGKGGGGGEGEGAHRVESEALAGEDGEGREDWEAQMEGEGWAQQ